MANGIQYLKRPCSMYGKNARVMSSILCKSSNYKHGAVYIAWLSLNSHFFFVSHMFHALILHNVIAFQFLLKFSPTW